MTLSSIELDGSQGEGGGQILRTALTLSMITGRPFCIKQIRARRAKPGLLRQHLTAVMAAQQVCGAEVEGAHLGSTSLRFTPGTIRGGDYQFAIGSAGSTTLVLQTLLPALWFADAEATVRVSGGTHNPAAPPVDFLQQVWLPLVHKMGVTTQIECLRHGFFPAGGGEVLAHCQPCSLQGLTLEDRGAWQSTRAIAVVAGVPGVVGERELSRIESQLPVSSSELRTLPSREGPGNVVMLWQQFEHVSEMSIAFGEKGVAAPAVADQAVREARLFAQSQAAVGEHLADQLALPLALGGGGSFTTREISSHLRTNLDVISKFWPVESTLTQLDAQLWRVEIFP